MTEGVDLKAAKIIHSKTVEQDINMMFVCTRHQYIPRCHILRHLSAREIEEARNEFRMGQLHVAVVGSFFIPGTQFVAVTQYQNAEVAEVKIDENAFATAHRERRRGVLQKTIFLYIYTRSVNNLIIISECTLT
uniref:T-box domain-containing protein n=1 Tax=Mesocestoides corti TaxID=53468 RepID=A0A5K3G280_MESCO